MSTQIKELAKSLKDSAISNKKDFLKLYQKFMRKTNEQVIFQELQNHQTFHYDKLSEAKKIPELLKQTVVCRLNGGLGTTLGSLLPKFSIPVKNKKTFLDLVAEQLQSLQKRYKAEIPFLLMNSFYTHQATSKAIKKYKDLKIYSFQQNCYPRLEEKTLTPLNFKEFGTQAYYPPGHGDFYANFQKYGLLEMFIQQGKKYLFISNIDNLGGNLDVKILNFMQQQNCPFLIEAVLKNPQDTKGGYLLFNKNSKRIKLLEIIELEMMPALTLQSLKEHFTLFNTNNLWINLLALQKNLKKSSWQLDLVKNCKQIISLGNQKKNILQLENTIASAVSNFKEAKIIQVHRSRFIPVKNKKDLDFIRFYLSKEK